MIHVQKIKIVFKNKTYWTILNKTFVRNADELKKLLAKKEHEFLNMKFKGRIPEMEEEKQQRMINTASVHRNVPDREFLFYVASEFNLKTVPHKWVRISKEVNAVQHESERTA